MSDCPRAGRWIGGCKFRPRYDEVSGTTVDHMLFSTLDIRPTPARKTYLGDVCSTCGKMLFRRRDGATK